MPEVSPSVLIIRLDGIGDALALTPSLAALQDRAIPVDLVLRPSNAGTFAPRAVRDVIVADFELRSGARSNLAAIQRLGRDLRSRHYTHVAVATEDSGGYRLAAAVGAPVRIGFEDPWNKPFKALWSRRLLTNGVYRSARLTRTAHEYETVFTLIAPLVGDDVPTREPARLRRLVLASEPAADNRVAVQITDKWARLGMPLESVADLVRRLAEHHRIHLLSSSGESAYSDLVERATGIPVSIFDDLQSWKAAIGAAIAIVTPDSGALHVAGTIGTPVVAIFPPQKGYAAQVARWAPWAAPYHIVRADADWPAHAAEALDQLLPG